jgi:hypothetical protein
MYGRLPTYGSLFAVACLISISGCDRAVNAPAFQPPKSKAAGTSGETAMSQEQVWNDNAREDLRTTLRRVILGEMRLAKRDHKEILEACREVYIEDECPESEQRTFIQFAADELARAEAQLASEKSAWPAVTDCDRLDRVEAALRERGILLWQVSPCCDTCTVGELPERIHEVSRRHPGFQDRIRGYAFFIDQNMPDELADSTELSVYLAYGWLSPDHSEVAPEVYEKNALGIAREVCQCLRNEGFEVNWNGDFSRKIGVSINWQRRNRLE